MHRRRQFAIGSGILILLLAGIWVARIGIDEYIIDNVQPRATRAKVIAALGRPNLELNPVPDDFLYREPRTCGGDRRPASLLLYSRGNFRRSALIYLDDAGRVQCVDRRGFMIIGH